MRGLWRRQHYRFSLSFCLSSFLSLQYLALSRPPSHLLLSTLTLRKTAFGNSLAISLYTGAICLLRMRATGVGESRNGASFILSLMLTTIRVTVALSLLHKAGNNLFPATGRAALTSIQPSVCACQRLEDELTESTTTGGSQHIS